LEIADRTHVVALGISTEGVKIPLGLWEGSTENATLVGMLLADLVDRGLDPEQAILFVIDGGKALRRAIKDVFGERALVHRCHRHYLDLRVIPTRVDDCPQLACLAA
jgi:putative transposase